LIKRNESKKNHEENKLPRALSKSLKFYQSSSSLRAENASAFDAFAKDLSIPTTQARIFFQPTLFHACQRTGGLVRWYLCAFKMNQHLAWIANGHQDKNEQN
jgi:hypothetical protein